MDDTHDGDVGRDLGGDDIPPLPMPVNPRGLLSTARTYTLVFVAFVLVCWGLGLLLPAALLALRPLLYHG